MWLQEWIKRAICSFLCSRKKMQKWERLNEGAKVDESDKIVIKNRYLQY